MIQSTLDRQLHVGMIMDGNGRWATRRGLPRSRGHEAGIEALRRIVKLAPDHGIGTLTLYAFSSDNWRRPYNEVSMLMALLLHYLKAETPELVRDGVRLSIIGHRDRLPEGLAEEIARSEEATREGQRLHLRVAIDYSARAAILKAAQAAAGISPLTSAKFSELVTGDKTVPDVDLLIRTSGEQRLSDFLLWESAYAELYFTDTNWPDFGKDDLVKALSIFRGRERRFGGLSHAAE